MSGPSIDLTFLTRPSLYRSVPLSVPPALLHSKHQPPPNTDLDTLLSHGHYRHAATKSAALLTSGTILDTPRILDLYHTRLATLLLASHPEIAIQEARPLLDWIAHRSSTSRPGSPATGHSYDGKALVALIPWPLRILLHRLSTLGTGDRRRGIMGLYALAAEARTGSAEAARCQDYDSHKTWATRASELAALVISELIDMGENETAHRMLSSLPPEPRALAYLRLGDLKAAETCLPSASSAGSPSVTHELMPALIAFANQDYTVAETSLLALHERYPDNEVVANNLALAQVYTGHLDAARERLDGSLSKTGAFRALVTNMACLYELSGDRSRVAKTELIARVAESGPRGGGMAFELQAADFKL